MTKHSGYWPDAPNVIPCMAVPGLAYYVPCVDLGEGRWLARMIACRTVRRTTHTAGAGWLTGEHRTYELAGPFVLFVEDTFIGEVARNEGESYRAAAERLLRETEP